MSNLSLLSLSILNSYNNIFIIHIHFILQDQFQLEGDSNLVKKTIVGSQIIAQTQME